MESELSGLSRMARGLRLVTLGVLGMAMMLPASAAALTAEVPLAPSGTPPITLAGGVARFQGDIELPPRWNDWSGELRLSWRGSDQLASGSVLRVSAGGTILGTRSVGPGSSGASFPLVPGLTSRDGRRISVLIEARLITQRNRCPAPDDLDAFLQLTRGSALRLQGDWTARPAVLRRLPEALLTGVGRSPHRLLVRFAQEPTAEMLQAASVAVGEVMAVAEGRTVAVRVGTPSKAIAPRVDEAVVTIERTSMPGVITVAPSVRRATRVTISGQPDELVAAAAGLRPSVARELAGSRATGLVRPVVRHPSIPRRIALPTGRFNGFGEGSVTLPFQLPPHREALRGARLRMAVDYNAPAGGRAQVIVNGRVLTTETLRSRGPSRFSVEEELAGRGPALQRADLRAGLNQVTVNTDMAYPRERCRLPEQVGTLSVSDFGSVTLLTRARPVQATLSTFPFPLNATAGWGDATVVLPAEPTAGELAAVLATLGVSRRVTDELVIPRFQLGGELPSGPALVFARPGAAPGALTKAVNGPKPEGLLTATATEGGVKILAVGERALRPFTREYEVGKVQGRVAQVTAEGNVIVRVSDPQRVTGVERGPTSWRWPLIIVLGSALALLALALRGAIRRVRRSDEA